MKSAWPALQNSAACMYSYQVYTCTCMAIWLYTHYALHSCHYNGSCGELIKTIAQTNSRCQKWFFTSST